jgi:hypothetical protein
MCDKLTKKEELDALLESWKVAVDTQRHFNEMAMRIKHFGFILLAAICGAAGLSIRSSLTIEIYNYNVPIGSFIMAFGAIIWGFIYFLDTKWYSPFLTGAVITATNLEAKLNIIIPNAFCHSSDITEESNNIKFLWWKVNSSARASIFHFGMISILLILALLITLTSSKVAG